MGNEKSKLNKATETPLHPKLLNPYVFEEKGHKLMTIKVTSTNEQYNEWRKTKKNFKQMIKKDRHLFWPISAKFNNMSFFGSNGYCSATFPYCPVTMKEEIVNRSKSNIPFHQK